MASVDYIILGQGIAGSVLALTLMQNGAKVLIVDNMHKTCSSKVAAGVLNPVTGIRMVKTYLVEKVLPKAKNFYPNLENTLSCKFFHQARILQLCKSSEEKQRWDKRQEDESYREFLGQYNQNCIYDNLKDENGSFTINSAGWLDMPILMKALAQYFLSKNVLLHEDFDFKKLKENSYNGIKFKKIIFAEGYKALENPYFNYLPFRPAKGEILEIKMDHNLPKEKVIHKGNWILPTSDDVLKIGSTWDRENLNETPTVSAKAELEKALFSIIKNKTKYQIISQQAGVRPCTQTTRPFLGLHPKIESFGIFNGFGSKGAFVSPFFASEYCLFLENGYEFDCQSNIQRHTKKFFKQ